MKRFVLSGIIYCLGFGLLACSDDASSTQPDSVENSSSTVLYEISSSSNTRESSSSADSVRIEIKETCTEVAQCDGMVKIDVSTWRFTRKDAFGNDVEYIYSVDGSTLVLTTIEEDGTKKVDRTSYSFYDMTKEVSQEMAFSAAKATCKDGGGNDIVKKTCVQDTIYTKVENYDWIDGKHIFPAGTFECKAETCMSTEPLSESVKYGEILDERDGQVYKVVKIGDQVWFAQNLNFKTDGSVYEGEYVGRKYTWTDLMDVPVETCGWMQHCEVSENHQGRCPAGWHIPSADESITLFRTAGPENNLVRMTSKFKVSINSIVYNLDSDDENSTGLSVVASSYVATHGSWIEQYATTSILERERENKYSQFVYTWHWCVGWGKEWTPETLLTTSQQKDERSSLVVRCLMDD